MTQAFSIILHTSSPYAFKTFLPGMPFFLFCTYLFYTSYHSLLFSAFLLFLSVKLGEPQ